jgi:hypothetical protein
MVNRLLIVAACLATAAIASPSAQSDLDDLMSRVLARRDDNWKKLQQYTLNERESVQITALAVFRLYGFEREYLWFPRAGFFVRSPLKADGVEIGEKERQREEERFLRRSRSLEQRLAERQQRRAENQDPCAPPRPRTQETAGSPPPPEPSPAPPADGSVNDIISQSFEPSFIRSANFLRFRFDQGQYALVGREQMLDRDVLKIEYYPTMLFDDPPDERRRNCPDRRSERQKEMDRKGDEIEEKMNKVALVTLWVDPAENQILRYEFRNIDMDFLPARQLVQIDGLTATMQMSEPFPNVWLPASIGMRFRMTLAVGPVEGRYDVTYTDYRLPTVGARVR